MAKEDLSVKIGASFVGKAAFRQAEKSITKLGKQVAGLALGGGLLNFGRSTIQAFYESEKSAKSLYTTLNNLGLAFRKDDINKYIDSLSRATGIVDETLNPAMQQLLLTTRNVEKSQKILGVALDISATTGDSLGNVVDSLSKAYQGNTKGLAAMKLGITKTQLAANNFDDILKYLSVTFDGQASVAAQGFTGNMDKLKVSIDQIKESIGKGLIEGINADGNIDKNTESLANLGKVLEKVAYGIAFLSTVGKTNLFSKDFWRGLVGDPTAKRFTGTSDGSDRGGASKIADAKMAAKQKAAADAQLKATKALTKAQTDQLKLKKAGTMFDTEQANILIALQGKITENEKLRLQLQLALLQGNTAEADRLSNELLISQAQTTGLATFIANLPKALNPFADYPYYVQKALEELAKLANAQKNINLASPTQPLYQYNSLSQQLVEGTTTKAAQGYGGGVFDYNLNPTTPLYGYNSMPQSTFNITVNGATQGLLDELRTGLVDYSASGSSSKLNRLALFD